MSSEQSKEPTGVPAPEEADGASQAQRIVEEAEIGGRDPEG